ncbi:hypothetical protein MJO28_016105 [Puccinia striiformis f. sp. tritici]|uniref:Uncharacterized protein n=1 Tax=Puccinia striiformis f. sp. tritici TaxID=168172 RepID=A0ACC0DSK1_9BASI|nr:hypothetical protein MJO28_016105 [Puccinia striiformis f. sp. tritici]
MSLEEFSIYRSQFQDLTAVSPTCVNAVSAIRVFTILGAHQLTPVEGKPLTSETCLTDNHFEELVAALKITSKNTSSLLSLTDGQTNANLYESLSAPRPLACRRGSLRWRHSEEFRDLVKLTTSTNADGGFIHEVNPDWAVKGGPYLGKPS